MTGRRRGRPGDRGAAAASSNRSCGHVGHALPERLDQQIAAAGEPVDDPLDVAGVLRSGPHRLRTGQLDTPSWAEAHGADRDATEVGVVVGSLRRVRTVPLQRRNGTTDSMASATWQTLAGGAQRTQVQAAVVANRGGPPTGGERFVEVSLR